jgi:hypothetical protein
MITEKQRNNLLELRRRMSELPPSQYNHRRYFSECGAPACALGWAAHFNIGGLEHRDRAWYAGFMVGAGVELAPIVFGEGSFDAIFDCAAHISRKYWRPFDVVAAIDRYLDANSNTLSPMPGTQDTPASS